MNLRDYVRNIFQDNKGRGNILGGLHSQPLTDQEVARAFMYASGCLWAGVVAAAASGAPTKTDILPLNPGVRIASTATITPARTGAGAYKMTITGIPATVTAARCFVVLTGGSKPMRAGAISVVSGSLVVPFVTDAGTDDFTGVHMAIYYL